MAPRAGCRSKILADRPACPGFGPVPQKPGSRFLRGDCSVNSMETLKILYVEDDQRAAGEFQELAATRGDVVAWDRTGSGGLLPAGMGRFDVIILHRLLGALAGLTTDRKRGV